MPQDILPLNISNSSWISNETLLSIQGKIANQIIQFTQGILGIDECLKTTAHQILDVLRLSECIIFEALNHQLKIASLDNLTTTQLTKVFGNFYKENQEWLARWQKITMPNSDQQFHPTLQDWAKDYGLGTILIVPLLHRQSFYGAISLLVRGNKREWQPQEIAFVQAIADHWAMALYNTELEQHYQVEIENRQDLLSVSQGSESRNRALLKIIPDAILQVTRDGICLDWKAGKTDTLPLLTDDIIGKHLHHILPTEIAGLIWENIELAMENKQVEIVEYQLWLNGKVRNLEIRLIESGTEEVAAIVQDVTDRVQALLTLEQVNEVLEVRVEKRTAALRNINQTLKAEIIERQRVEDKLRASEEKFRQLTENIREVFFLTTPDLKQILYISPAYEEVSGCSPESLYENPKTWLKLVHPEDRDRIVAAVARKFPEEKDWQEEYRIVRPDGSERWVWVRAFRVLNEAGVVTRIAGIAEDITERKQAQADILNALAKEKELSELKSRFISTTSHEFRTPLTTINSSAELLEHYGEKWSVERKITHLHRIQASVTYMTKLLNDVLVIGKAEAGKLKLSTEALDLENFCRTLVEEMQLQDRNQHPIVFSIGSEEKSKINIPSFRLPQMDKQLLRAILENLLSNGIKYSPKESTINLILSYHNEQAIFQISDRGIGIPLPDKERLFETFHRATNVGTIPGTGLGLTIVKKCVDIHQGQISVESEVGVGTTFTVTLPMYNSLSTDEDD
ncbi:sensor histidine kinase [Limnofasciculus baicalensis]|uniref:histidine kinase n=1 Tax=Limnofasciculus baicalensis BBK-W-15 TaxID=2699891 RepID=A0AAE3KQ42_9CYAN|nr:ATP-binding protein [Limnofasciculus baicalensis]MCP2730303.1 PAS domain S-box protein [Limnofasciculus baicalensis BBK-W-15]